jgi:maltooligosyltrehalose trehalohydrolase
MTTPAPPAELGASLDGEQATFCVWAPDRHQVDLVLIEPVERTMPMTARNGYYVCSVEGLRDGQRYGFRLDSGGAVLRDPASRHQPDGVHGPSALLGRAFDWCDDGWRGPRLEDYVIYELHIGTFTPEGTFAAAAERLEQLRDLGVTVLELMPVAQFPGTRNWGYDGVFPFAVQNTYGGPVELKRFVDRCHAAGMAVCLDVVYNHLGPEGNVLDRFGPYFIDRYQTPWGDALNFDGPGSDHVREYFIRSALQWVDEFHIDALRIDAVHAIMDQSAHPFLAELAERVHECARTQSRNVSLIAESDLGDPRIVRPPARGGIGMDAQWLDDFHHALHTVLTGERTGYYQDYGRVEQLARAFRDCYVYSGQYSVYRERRHGAPAEGLSPHRFVVFAQNHDQIGNRMSGDRLARTLTFEQLKLAATTVLLSPFTPLLFMGEEYGETAPFPYFVSHSEPELMDSVRRGRAEEFAAFAWAGEAPDPQAEETFRSAVLDWECRARAPNAVLVSLHRELLRARRELAPLRAPGRSRVDAGADAASALVRVTLASDAGDALLLLHFGTAACRTAAPEGARWRMRIDTAAAEWRGPGRIEPRILSGGSPLELPPHSAVLLVRCED